MAFEIVRWSLPIQISLPGCPEHCREGLLVRFHTSDDVVGFGDCCPLPGFSTETLAEAQQALMSACRRLASDQHLVDRCREHGVVATLGQYPSSVCFALESALTLNRSVSSVSLPECRLLTGSTDSIIQQAQRLGSRVSAVKLKVGRCAANDELALIHTLDSILGQAVKLRLDGNRGWNLSEAIEFTKQLPLHRIAFLEEPLRNPAELPTLFEHTGCPVALDESLQARFGGHQHLPQVFPGLAALVVKPTLSGGIHRSRELAWFAHSHGLELVLSSSYESNIGIETLRLLAEELAPATAPGLDTLSAFSGYLLKQPEGMPSHAVSSWAELTPVWSSSDSTL
ncbi:o-succinylbenzoate synthase [Parendozoicomonas haliclonae]|uniref:o-succinylbenzoate synthase n=1 Tax=Parendozoicomonas haliclonae TaxID=1960125 RepID=A0A1X7AMF9_9GAMM|nr:o-succinylbenzoate synthase [Parendozoicomonas haliclonae]SMA49443.1 o-succinylbenzoate synthase [Parendozoicomonas haliclonae]